ncbi:NAD(P)/FAD-dependent oxidoreductase [Sulfobacillus thermotolerans]|uniref:NAD(P)/FAD-dependent oxidoreductase n=1 Tax=Sulfobacillus thermotolerans TaxID=338644 RepID=UPI003D2FFBB5
MVIIGGGPSGASSALLLDQFGYKVCLVEKDEFPRFHIGESLLSMSAVGGYRAVIRHWKRFAFRCFMRGFKCCGDEASAPASWWQDNRGAGCDAVIPHVRF